MLRSILKRGTALKKKGRKGKGFGRLFAGPDESARNAFRSRREADLENDDLETPEDILAKYGKYLDEDGVPFKGINPKPKYYVVPKEVPEEELTVSRQPIVHQILTTPAPQTPKPKKATVKKVQKTDPKTVVVKKRCAPEPAPKKVTVRKVEKPVTPEPETTAKTIKIKVKSKS